MITRKALLLVLLIIGLIASGLVAVQRVRVESRNRAVDLVIDYGEVAQIVAGTGKDPVTVLRELKKAGATGVAVTEDTIRSLVDSRSITPYGPHHFAVDQAVAPRVEAYLRMALAGGGENVKLTPVGEGQYSYLTIEDDLPIDYIYGLPVGLPESAVAQARAAGLEVVARLVSYPGATPRAIDAMLADVAAKGITRIVFLGDQVLGYRGATKQTAAAMRRHGLYFGQIEFARQKGEVDIAERIPGRIIVVHSISSNEMPTMSPRSIAERFEKAAKERGVRMCYIRMLETASPNLLKSSTDYVSMISRSIEKSGFSLKASHPLEEVRAPIYLRVLAGLGVAAGLMLLVLEVVNLSVQGMLWWTVAAVVICAGLAAGGDTGRKAVALLSACVFPTLGAMVAIRNSPESPTPVPSAASRALGRMVVAVAAAAVGGMLIVGLLSSRTFMLRIDQFAGIKLAHIAPILVLAALFAGGIAWRSDAWAAQKRKMADSLRAVASSPVLIWQAVGLVALLVVLGLVVARSGNEAGLQVSGTELKFRALLDRVMLVRPRTKEFLLGYPALMLGIAFALRGRRQWAAPLVVIGSIGLISALNTFCHIHTPLAVSALRVLNGLIVGSIIGLIAYWLLRNLPGRESK